MRVGRGGRRELASRSDTFRRLAEEHTDYHHKLEALEASLFAFVRPELVASSVGGSCSSVARTFASWSAKDLKTLFEESTSSVSCCPHTEDRLM